MNMGGNMEEVATANGTSRGPLEHFEPFDQELANSYAERVSAIRDRHPVAWSDAAWSEKGSGFWLLTGFEDVSASGQDWQRFSSAQGAAPVQFDLDVFRMVPLETDPPIHRDIRRVLSPFFAPDVLKSAEEKIRQLVRELLDACVAESPCDFTEQFTVAVPSRVFFEIFLGEDPKEIAWMIETIKTLFAHPESAMDKAPDLLGWCATVLEARRSEGRSDDVLGAIAHAGNDADFELTEMDRIQTVFLLILAGMETTASGLGNILHRLAIDAELRLSLRGIDAPTLNHAVDEFLRIDSPVPASGRTLIEDVELGGCPMKSGDRVLLNWAAANRDPAMFANPDRLEIGRSESVKHVAFGAGPHRCLGSHVARREIRVVLEEIAKLETFELVPGTEVTFRAGPARGPASLPIICSG
jgi:cytochrome P450